MFTNLHAKNFKAFEHFNVDLRPITLVLGPNNSGKSSVFAALRLLAQTASCNDPEVPLLLNGQYGDFGTYRDLVYGNNRNRTIEIGVSRESDAEREKTPYTKSFSLTVRFRYRVQRRQIVQTYSELSSGSDVYVQTALSSDTDRQVVQAAAGYQVPPSLRGRFGRALRMINFVPYLAYYQLRGEQLGPAVTEWFGNDFEDKLRAGIAIQRSANDALRKVEFLSAMRLPPERTYLFTGERRQTIGRRGENMAAILATESTRPRKGSKNVLESVSRWLHAASIGAKLDVHSLTDRHYELRVQHPVTKETENLADVGYGHSQVLPVLVGGYSLRPGDTYIIEEPEIHLHPNAQAALGDFFVELQEGGIQTLAETHSEYIVLRLQQHVASGRISPSDVAIYFVYPHKDKKAIARVDLDGRGRFTSEWPRGFFPERLEEAKQLSRIRMERDA